VVNLLTNRALESTFTLKIDLEIKDDLAYRLQEAMKKGYFASKPEAIRQSLRLLLDAIDEKELQKKRLEMITS